MYAGEQYDSITGQYYLRSRYYDPVVGRFTQEDIFSGDGTYLYAYVGNNPLKYVDPFGYCKEVIYPSKPVSDVDKVLNDASVPDYVKDGIRQPLGRGTPMNDNNLIMKAVPNIVNN